MQEIEIWQYEQVVYIQTRMHPEEWDAQNSLEFWDANRSPYLGQTTRPSDSQQKKRTCQIMNFAILVDHRVKITESEKKVEFLEFAREQKNYGTWRWPW